MNEGPLTRPFVVLSGGNDEFAVFDGDAHLLAGEESGVLDPPAGELDPRVKLGWFEHVRRLARSLIAKILLNLDGAFRKTSCCFMIGISHSQLS
jgi:hypothetical protein